MCTGIFIKTKDGKYIFGRTLEFGVFLKWKQVCDKDLVGTKGNF
jgi:penicillin V acylase-like amidase (Ntn superfamily)